MEQYTVHRPREEALRRILDRHPYDAVGMIFRLAWQAGLLRGEIVSLRWDDVDFLNQELRLPDRNVPLAPELEEYLARMSERMSWGSDYVLLSDRLHRPMQPQPVSHLVRRELDAEGETQVRLIDLRHDFIIRQLQEHDWQYVSRITGVEAPALHAHFGGYLDGTNRSTKARRGEDHPLDELRLWKLLQAERLTPAGTALWLTWRLGLRLEEIVALRWDQVDGESLHLPGRRVPLTGGAAAMLRDLRAQNRTDEYVLTAPRSGRPYDRARLSKLARTALVNAGLDDVTIRDLRLDCDLRAEGERQVAAYLRSHPSINRKQAAELLGVSPAAAYRRLKRMARRGKLTQVGARYYLPAAVVPPEHQAEAILAYLAREGFAYRQDIARILQIDPRQCRPILQRMVAAGEIVQQRQRYFLKRRAAGEN